MNPLLADCPDAVRAYMTLAGGDDRVAAVALFGDDARVVDDGQHYTGTAGIRTWLGGVASRYTYTTTPIAVRNDLDTGQSWVQVRIEGTFPGGRAELDYHFRLDGSGRLEHLTIAPSRERGDR